MVIVKIESYNVKSVLVNQGSGAKIMYPDLYRGLNLRLEDLDRFGSSLMGFNGRMVVPRGMIKLPVQVGDVEVQVNFIVVEVFSLYRVILVRPWLHVVGAMPLTLHLKVKYPTQRRVGELVGDQAMARQCLVSAIMQRSSSLAAVTKDPVP